jgi:hypothetical protein
MFARYKHCILLIFVMIIFSGHFVQGMCTEGVIKRMFDIFGF